LARNERKQIFYSFAMMTDTDTTKGGPASNAPTEKVHHGLAAFEEDIDLNHAGEAHSPNTGCGICARYPVLSVLLFAASGVALGIGLSTWEPDNPDDKEVTVKWLGLIGDMFIRALKAIVLPLVFVNVILSIVDMMVRYYIAQHYLTATVLSCFADSN
jgi:hypothetical protein